MRQDLGWRGLSMMLCYMAFYWAVTPSSATLLENILYTQYDDASTFCSDDVEALGAAFEDGEDYFNDKFSDLIELVGKHTETLRGVEIRRQAPAPSPAVINNINVDFANDIKSRNIEVEKLEFMFGMDFDLLFCYKNGLFISCGDNRQATYEIPNPLWSYRFGCDGWTATFTQPDLRIISNEKYKIVVLVQFKLQAVDISQCSGSSDIGFSGTALCNSSISRCEILPNLGFVVGAYRCVCTECYSCDAINGTVLSDPAVDSQGLLLEQCTEKPYIRPSPRPSLRRSFLTANKPEVYGLLAVEGMCVILALILALVVLILCTSQVMKSARVGILMLILLGAVMRYAEIVVAVLEPSELMCLARPWLAEVSFVFMFGAIILKTYSTLVREDSEGSQNRHPLYRSWLLALLFTLMYLGSGTGASLEYLSARGVNVSDIIEPDGAGIAHMQCSSAMWGHVTQAAESVLLIVGLYLTFVLRYPRSDFSESKYFAGAMAIELVFSILHHVLGSVLMLNQYWTFILTFLHHQLTVTPIILLIVCPKFRCDIHKPSKPPSLWVDDNENTNLELRGDVGGTNGNTAVYTEASVTELTHQEAKKELVKAHEQLLILKSKLARYENSASSSDKSAHGTKKRYPKDNRDSETELEALNPPPTYAQLDI